MVAEQSTVPYVVCAFYTRAYEEAVRRLEVSLRAFDLPFETRRVEPRASWAATTGIKPGFLHDCLAKHAERDVLYVDADAFVRRPLGDFSRFDGELGLYFNLDLERPGRLRTGTIYARNVEPVRAFLGAWSRIQAERPDLQDTQGFKLACREPEARAVRFFSLPVEYVAIFDRDRVEARIEHLQESRHRPDGPKAKRRAQQRRRRLAFASLAALLLFALGFIAGRFLAGG